MIFGRCQGERANAEGVDTTTIHDHTLSMTLSEMLREELVLPKIACTSKDELISKLVDRILETDKNLPFLKNEVMNIVNMREQIGGTLLPSGLSIPHARLRNFEGFVLALGTPQEALFHEGLQIHMMALMFTSQSGGAYYLPVLAALTKISKDREFFARLCEAGNSAGLIQLIREQDMELV